jgi:hypothetical protein
MRTERDPMVDKLVDAWGDIGALQHHIRMTRWALKRIIEAIKDDDPRTAQLMAQAMLDSEVPGERVEPRV